MMRTIKLLLLIVLLVIGQSLLAQSDDTSLDDRGYGLYVPTSYDEDGDDEMPLLIVLHGFGDTWENFYPATGFIPRADSENFIVAFAQGYLHQWNDGDLRDHDEDDVQIFRDLVDRVERDYRVDRNRIYLVGFSNGGTMVYKGACEAPDLFAAVAAVGGTMRVAQAQECDGVQLPILMIHGNEDEVVPFDGGSEFRFSVPRASIFWAEQNECNLESVPFYSEGRFVDGYASYFYEECPNGNYVVMYVLQGLGHTWAGAEYYVRGLRPQDPQKDTARIVWSFFELTYQASLNAIEAETTPEAED